MNLEQQRSQKIDKLTTALSQPAQIVLNNILDQPIECLGFAYDRTSECLKDEGIYLLRDLVVKTQRDLMRAPGIGKAALSDIKNKLGKLGLSLGMELPEPHTPNKPSLLADSIPEGSMVVGDEILTSGAIIYFLNEKQATSFVSAAKPMVFKDSETASFHVKRLDIQTTAERKMYPVYVSDEALGKLTTPKNLKKLSNPKQKIGQSAFRV